MFFYSGEETPTSTRPQGLTRQRADVVGVHRYHGGCPDLWGCLSWCLRTISLSCFPALCWAVVRRSVVFPSRTISVPWAVLSYPSSDPSPGCFYWQPEQTKTFRPLNNVEKFVNDYLPCFCSHRPPWDFGRLSWLWLMGDGLVGLPPFPLPLSDKSWETQRICGQDNGGLSPGLPLSKVFQTITLKMSFHN